MRALVRQALTALVFASGAGAAASCSGDPAPEAATSAPAPGAAKSAPAPAATGDSSTPAGRQKAAELVRRFMSMMKMYLAGAGKDVTDPELVALRADSQALGRSSEMSPEFNRRFERLLAIAEMFFDRYGTPAASRDPAQLERLQAFAREVQGPDRAGPTEDRLDLFAVPIAEEAALLALFVEGTTDPAKARAILEQRHGTRPK